MSNPESIQQVSGRAFQKVPIDPTSAEEWLGNQELQYATRPQAGGVRLRMTYLVGLREWEVRRGVSELLYRGEDLYQAVRVFNDNE